jgi:hypothetical protein
VCVRATTSPPGCARKRGVMYGDWRQWKQRLGRRKKKGRGNVMGVRCSVAHAIPVKGCPDCETACAEWLKRNGAYERSRISLGEGARRMAGQ